MTKEWKINVQKYLSYGKQFCKGVIRALFDSEGSVYIDYRNKKCTISFSSTNLRGVESLQKLLSHFYLYFKINSLYRRDCTEHRLRCFSIENIISFYNKVDFSIDYKREKLKEFIGIRELPKMIVRIESSS